MSKYKTRAAEVLAQLGVTASLEDNDLNINIQAEHEGDADNAGEGTDLGEFDNSAVEETVAVEPVDEEALVADTSGTPETAELDVVEADAAAGDVTGKMDQVGDAVEALESMAIQIATLSLENREPSPATVAALNIQYDFITRNFPKMQKSESRVASCEDYAADYEKAHNVSLESVMGKIKEGAKAVWKWFRDLATKIAAFFGHALSAATVMGNKAKALKEKAQRTNEYKVVDVPAIIGGKLDAQHIKTLTDFLKAMATQDYKELATAIEKGEETKESATYYAILSGGSSKAIRAYKGKDLIGNIKITGGDTSYFKCELSEGKASTIKFGKGTAVGIADAVIALSEALGDYKRTQAVRIAAEKRINAAESKIGDDQGKMARASKWLRGFGEVRAFERRIVARALAVGNAANNVLSKAVVEAKADDKDDKK